MKEEIQNEQELKELIEYKNRIVKWIKAHKKQLIYIGISIPIIFAIVLGLKNKDAVKELFSKLKLAAKNASIYSENWFKNATYEQLDAAREEVRVQFCSSGDDYQAACSLQNLLERFDKEMRKKSGGNNTPYGPSIHREHGWYLPNDD